MMISVKIDHEELLMEDSVFVALMATRALVFYSYHAGTGTGIFTTYSSVTIEHVRAFIRAVTVIR